MAEPARSGAASLHHRPISETVDPYHHPIMPAEVGWLTKALACAIDHMPPTLHAEWQQRIRRQQAISDPAQGATDAILPSVAVLANWVVETRLRTALLEGLRRGDLTPAFGPDASTPAFSLTPQGHTHALDLVDYLEQTAVAPLRRGTARLGSGTDTTAGLQGN